MVTSHGEPTKERPPLRRRTQCQAIGFSTQKQAAFWRRWHLRPMSLVDSPLYPVAALNQQVAERDDVLYCVALRCL